MTTLTDSPQTSTADIIQRVADLAPGFRARATLTEQQRTVPRETIDELIGAGVARLMVPSEHGGLDGRIRDLIDVTVTAAHACPSTGWLTGLMCAVSRTFALYPREVQDAVWAAGPDVVGAASIGLKATPVAGGYRVSGASPFASGINNAQWVYIIGQVPQPAGPPKQRIFLIPRADYAIKDTWHTEGMRGTGSNTVLTDDVFVADAYTVSIDDAREGSTPGAAVNSNPSFALPWSATGSLTFVSAMLGAAEGAYEDVVGILRTKRTPSGQRTADSEYVQVRVTYAAGRIAVGRTLIYRLADRADARPDYTIEERAEALRDMALAATMIKEAVEALIEISGTSGFSTSSFTQQAWRDVNFAAAHQGLNARVWGGHYGRIVLDIEHPSMPLFY